VFHRVQQGYQPETIILEGHGDSIPQRDLVSAGLGHLQGLGVVVQSDDRPIAPQMVEHVSCPAPHVEHRGGFPTIQLPVQHGEQGPGAAGEPPVFVLLDLSG